jgi:DNA polymerase III sliding clamp (beta) subunit (PCNA family)
MTASKLTIDREALVKITGLVRPALSTQSYIPALQTIKFSDGFATAYNDISAISVRSGVDLDTCLPGELLIRALGSFSAEQILIRGDGDTGVVLSSGRSQIKMPAQPVKDYPLSFPNVKDADEVTLDHSILKGIAACLISVGNDPTHPAQMGVTLDVDERDCATLFSTDNFTISRYQTKSKIKLPGNVPVILPRFFCEQLVTLAKVFSDDEVTLLLFSGSIMVEFGKNAKLFTKTLVDLQPLDFPKIMAKHCKVINLKEQLSDIPDSFDSAFARALLVLGGETDKATKITLGDGNFKMNSTSAMGDADDTLPYKGEMQDEPQEAFFVDPTLVARASKVCALMGFSKSVLVLADADVQFVHLVAYCAG